jgi:endonuclease G
MKKFILGVIFGALCVFTFYWWNELPDSQKQQYKDKIINSIPAGDGVSPESGTLSSKGHAYAGLPKSHRNLKILENIAFTVGYDEVEMNPAWVCYRIPKVDNPISLKRPSGFDMDTRTISKVSHGSYTNSGFDRGHMAPNSAIATRFGAAAQKETFLMSNIVPQAPGLNRGIWRLLEDRIVNVYSVAFEEVWVTTGPIYDSKEEEISSGVEIPDGFFKIIIDEDKGKLRVLSFLIPETASKQSFDQFLTSVDQIEQLTGLDFFTELPDPDEEKLESWIPSRIW